MTVRGASGGCMPSRRAASQPPAYHAHDTPRAERVSPIVLWVCGGNGLPAGSANRGSPPGAGGTWLGWKGGCSVFTAKPSGVTLPSRNDGGPVSADAGESGVRSSPPSGARRARSDAGASEKTGVHAHTSQKWFRNDPPNALMKKWSASVYSRAHRHIGSADPS